MHQPSANCTTVRGPSNFRLIGILLLFRSPGLSRPFECLCLVRRCRNKCVSFSGEWAEIWDIQRTTRALLLGTAQVQLYCPSQSKVERNERRSAASSFQRARFLATRLRSSFYEGKSAREEPPHYTAGGRHCGAWAPEAKDGHMLTLPLNTASGPRGLERSPCSTLASSISSARRVALPGALIGFLEREPTSSLLEEKVKFFSLLGDRGDSSAGARRREQPNWLVTPARVAKYTASRMIF